MSVIATSEIHEGRDGSIDEGSVRRFTRTFRVRTDNPYDGPLTVLVQSSVPRVGDFYAEQSGAVDTGSRCRSVTPTQDQNERTEWMVRCEYSSERPAQSIDTQQGRVDPAEWVENPLLRPATYRWGTSATTRVVDKAELLQDDLSWLVDQPVANSAGYKFDPPPEIEEFNLTLSVVRNEAIFDPFVAYQYTGAINTDVFLGLFAADVARCLGITGESQFENGSYFWRVSYEFEFRFGGWYLVLLDAGYVDSAGEVFMDATNGVPRSDPTLLDGAGAELGDPTAPVFRTFRAIRQLPFSPLNIS